MIKKMTLKSEQVIAMLSHTLTLLVHKHENDYVKTSDTVTTSIKDFVDNKGVISDYSETGITHNILEIFNRHLGFTELLNMVKIGTENEEKQLEHLSYLSNEVVCIIFSMLNATLDKFNDNPDITDVKGNKVDFIHFTYEALIPLVELLKKNKDYINDNNDYVTLV